MHNACGWYQTQDTEGSAPPARPKAGQRDSAPASPSALHSPADRPATADTSGLSQLSGNVAVQVQGLVLPPKPAADQRDPAPALPSNLHSPTEGPNEDAPDNTVRCGRNFSSCHSQQGLRSMLLCMSGRTGSRSIAAFATTGRWIKARSSATLSACTPRNGTELQSRSQQHARPTSICSRETQSAPYASSRSTGWNDMLCSVPCFFRPVS